MQEISLPIGAKIFFFVLLFIGAVILFALILDIVTAILSLIFPNFQMGSALDFVLKILVPVLIAPAALLIILADEIFFIKPCYSKAPSSLFCGRR